MKKMFFLNELHKRKGCPTEPCCVVLEFHAGGNQFVRLLRQDRVVTCA